MNLARLRELTAAGQAGTIRPEELKELFEALPGVIRALRVLRFDATYCAKALIASVDWIEENGVDDNPEACDEHRVRAIQVLDYASMQ